jgi:hypothetical protein
LNSNFGGAHGIDLDGLERFAVQRGEKLFRIVADLKESECRSDFVKRGL